MRKILDINEIYSFEEKKLKVYDLTDYDLSALDLSAISPDVWVCKMKNTNFGNTNATFDFYYFIGGGDIENCNFEGTNITNSSFRGKFINCNFKNTSIKYSEIARHTYYCQNIAFVNCFLPDTFFEGYNKNIESLCWFDVDTVKENQNICFPEKILFESVCRELRKMDSSFINDVEDSIEFIRQYDKNGKLISFIETMNQVFKGDYNKLLTLLHDAEIYRVVFNNVYFDSGIMFDLPINIRDCVFKNCTFDAPVGDMFVDVKKKPYFVNYSNNMRKSKFESVIFPQMNHSSWVDIEENRISNSRITTRTNLYLELGRVCNARCEFCRNESFNRCKYDLESILDKLKLVSFYIDDLVIGGGEPTLLLEDLKKLIEYVRSIDPNREITKYVFSNGTAKIDVYGDLAHSGISLNISRHAISDRENRDILNCRNRLFRDRLTGNSVKNASTDNLRYLLGYGATMCATCFSGGLDTSKKILDYIEFANSLGAKTILLSNLHLDSSSGDLVSFDNMNIDSTIFQEVISNLEEQGFSKLIPIYSTGGYCSTALEDGNFKVIFKQYISKKDIELEWNRASKRTFDLSIDPSGRLFDNWHQQGDEVILPTKVKLLNRK